MCKAIPVLALTALFSVFAARGLAQSLTPVDLTIGSRTNPLGIAADDVSFAWTLQTATPDHRAQRQTAYRIVVATSAATLALHHGLVWDSGRKESKTFWQLPYSGPALQSHTTYYWQAQVWDGNTHNRAGRWSAVAHFTTGLLHPQDWKASWIAASPDALSASRSAPQPLPVFRNDFTVGPPIKSALLFVTGMGQYEVRLNGANVTGTVLNPGWTNYRKTVLYDTYDVTPLLHHGLNAVGVLLGNGMYNVESTRGRYTKFEASFGQPKCRLQLEVTYRSGATERFVTSSAWQSHTSPIVFSSIFGGEDEDARVLPDGWDKPGYPTDGWTHATEVSGPGGAMQASEAPPLTVAHTFAPVSIKTPLPGKTVYDLGQNMSGWPAIAVQGERGAEITLTPGELLNPDGTVSQRSTNAFPADPVLFRYTLRGDALPEQWHPRFSYHSFRYVQVEVAPAAAGAAPPQVLSLAGQFVHADVSQAGEFHSSEEIFNRTHQLIEGAVLSNLVSIITDCPSREKLGWLEETYLNAGTILWNEDAARLYAKVAHDIADAQLPDGLVPSIAPEYTAFMEGHHSTDFRDSPEWGSAAILSPWALYQFTGDTHSLAAHYGVMQLYAAYLQSRSKEGLLSYGLGDWYDIGPKAPGYSKLTTKAITATGVYYEDLTVLSKIARLLHHNRDAADYAQQAEFVRAAYNAKLFHPATDKYDRGSQTANAVPLVLGLVPPGHELAVLENLIADIHAHNDHVTAGDIGFHYVVRALTDAGRSDVLAAMFSRTDTPSYGYQLGKGATTLTEAWDANPNSSQNHFMLGHGEEWFYRGLAGLRVDMALGPDDAITLMPSFVSGVAEASASYRTSMGQVSLAWQQTATNATVQVTVPVGAQARLHLPPRGVWMENAHALTPTEGILNSRKDAAGETLLLGSGSYRFTAASAR